MWLSHSHMALSWLLCRDVWHTSWHPLVNEIMSLSQDHITNWSVETCDINLGTHWPMKSCDYHWVTDQHVCWNFPKVGIYKVQVTHLQAVPGLHFRYITMFLPRYLLFNTLPLAIWFSIAVFLYGRGDCDCIRAAWHAYISITWPCTDWPIESCDQWLVNGDMWHKFFKLFMSAWV